MTQKIHLDGRELFFNDVGFAPSITPSAGGISLTYQSIAPRFTARHLKMREKEI